MTVMIRCDKCGCDVVLPFTCQHCGGKFCPDCRLPPSHNCAGISSWHAKPRPAIGINYHKGGGVTTSGGVTSGYRRRPAAKAGEGLPYLKIMIGIIVLVLLGLAWLVLVGH
jgi:hypothetical protein